VIRFGQKENLAYTKTFDLLRYETNGYSIKILSRMFYQKKTIILLSAIVAAFSMQPLHLWKSN